MADSAARASSAVYIFRRGGPGQGKGVHVSESLADVVLAALDMERDVTVVQGRLEPWGRDLVESSPLADVYAPLYRVVPPESQQPAQIASAATQDGQWVATKAGEVVATSPDAAGLIRLLREQGIRGAVSSFDPVQP